MFRSYACVACEKVLLEKDDIASIIRLFNKVVLAVPADTEIPLNGVAPNEWSIYSAWDAEPGDEVKSNFVCIQILYPDGSVFGESRKVEMNVESKKRSQVAVKIIGFPVGQPGAHTVRCWVDQGGKVASNVVEFEIDLEVTHLEQQSK